MAGSSAFRGGCYRREAAHHDRTGMRLVVATHGIWADGQLGWRKNRIRQFGVGGMRIGAGASVILASERMGSGGQILE
jgi:hypothetical protein